MQGETLWIFLSKHYTLSTTFFVGSILRAQNGEMKIDYLFIKILRCSVLLLHNPRTMLGAFMRGLQNV